MYNFEYVSKKEAAPAKNELIEIINEVQDILRNKDISFQFQYTKALKPSFLLVFRHMEDLL